MGEASGRPKGTSKKDMQPKRGICIMSLPFARQVERDFWSCHI